MGDKALSPFKEMRRFLKYRLERWLQGGAANQLILIAALVVLVAVLGGVAAYVSGAGGFGSLGEAMWWSFLRLTDPGYLGDDEGTLLRVVSTTVTVLGYVLFMGSLIAILTQWLSSTLSTLERGLTPIAISNHILILGWTNRTPNVVEELVRAGGRAQRFLQRKGAPVLRIVILAEEVTPELRLELKTQLATLWKSQQIIFRSGSSLNLEHLQRANALKAAAIIVPGADFALGGFKMTDARVIKTLMSLDSFAHLREQRELPPVVAEVFDTHKLKIAQQTYKGHIDLIASDTFISRLIVQSARQQGLFHVYNELLSYAFGSELYIRSLNLGGERWSALRGGFAKAIPVGVVRLVEDDYRAILNPAPDFTLAADDRLILLAHSFEDAVFVPEPSLELPQLTDPLSTPQVRRRKLLILGWSHKVAALIREFAAYEDEQVHIDIMSLVPTSERSRSLARLHVSADRLTVNQLEGDYTLESDIEALELSRYDNVIFLGSDWLESDEASDARTVLGYVLLRSLLHPTSSTPTILVELMDPDNDRLFSGRQGEVIISSLLLSHMAAQTALRPELGAAYEALLGSGGGTVLFRPASCYGLVGSSLSIREVQQRVTQKGELALGFRLSDNPDEQPGGVYLNPSSDRQFTIKDADDVIVLSTSSS